MTHRLQRHINTKATFRSDKIQVRFQVLSFYHFIIYPEVDKTLPAKETIEKEQELYKRKQVKYQYVTLLPPLSEDWT